MWRKKSYVQYLQSKQMRHCKMFSTDSNLGAKVHCAGRARFGGLVKNQINNYYRQASL